jgi:hypothetical protein
MLEVLVGIALPPAVFGVFAILAMWLGAETRPWFDERPVLDDRPNWGPIRRRVPRDGEEVVLEVEDPRDGPLEPAVAAPAPRVQPRPAAVARAATSPSGV